MFRKDYAFMLRPERYLLRGSLPSVYLLKGEGEVNVFYALIFQCQGLDVVVAVCGDESRRFGRDMYHFSGDNG